MRAALRRRLARVEWDVLWATLVAAGASPGVRHRWATVGYLLNQAVLLERGGSKKLRAEDLPELLDECVQVEPRLLMLEDFLPEDPRDVVLVRLGDRTVRLTPGCIERPIADIDRALMVAHAVDEYLVEGLGFGIRHVLDVALTYVDAAIRVLSNGWPPSDVSLGGPIVFTSEELEAATALVRLGTPPEVCPSPEHESALEWLTCDAAKLPYEPAHPQSPFGRYMRIRPRGGQDPLWMPLAFIPEILGFAVGELAQTAMASPQSRRKFAQASASAARAALWRFGSVYGTADSGAGPTVAGPRSNVIQWVSEPTPGRAVLVHIVSDLVPPRIPFEEEPEAVRVAKALEGAAPDGRRVTAAMPRGSMHLDPRMHAVPLLVVSCSGHIATPHNPGLPALSLDDLRWMALTADATTDLYSYCRDMAREDLPPFMAWESIDIWEWWRANGKTFFAGGAGPSFVAVAAHAGTAEWRRARDLSTLEACLARLALPGVRDLVGIDHETGPPVVYYRLSAHPTGGDHPLRIEPPLAAWSLHLADVPVAVEALSESWTSESLDVLHDLSGSICFALRAVGAIWDEAHSEGSDVCGYRIRLDAAHRDGSGPALVTREIHITVDSGRQLALARIEFDLDIFEDATDISGSVRTAMADCVADVLQGAGAEATHVEAVRAAIQLAPPMLAGQAIRMPTVRNDMTSPIYIDDALLSIVHRRVAEQVRAAGVTPGTYRGGDAKRVDRDVLAPAALTELNRALAPYQVDDVVEFGMRQVERCLTHRDRQLRDVRQSGEALVVDWDPVERYLEVEDRYLTLRRCCEAAIEAAIRLSPSGRRPLDAIAWGEVLAAAHAYLEATNRSEGVHHQLTPQMLTISDFFEITEESDESGEVPDGSVGSGRVYDLNVAEMKRVRTRLQLTGIGATDNSGESLIDPHVDAEFLKAFGTSASNLLTVLFSLAHWPLEESDGDAVAVEHSAVVAHVLSSTTLGDEPEGEEQIRAAVDLLTSRSSDLAVDDWKPWHARSRKRRILIQPIPELSNGRLVVGPHLCLAVLTIYQRYLQQGQLPWSQPHAPAGLATALDRFREERNRALEIDVASVLRAEGWTVIANVKPSDPQRLGVPSLETEIDVVAGQAGEKRIWLLEVKDPADVFVIPEIRRALDHFYVDGKKPSYATQLARKHEDLRPHSAAVAAALGLPEAPPGCPYEILPLFVTRHPVPAAFVEGPFPFATLADLPDTLSGQHNE